MRKSLEFEVDQIARHSPIDKMLFTRSVLTGVDGWAILRYEDRLSVSARLLADCFCHVLQVKESHFGDTIGRVAFRLFMKESGTVVL